MTRLVFFPGWGYSAEVMRPLASELQDDFVVQLESLPDFAADDFVAQTASRVAKNSWLVGWSLGGMLAALLARHMQQDCAGLILLGCNPVFVQRTDWPNAMTPADFDAFTNSFQQQPQQTLQRFAMLCSQGAAQPRQIVQQLRSQLLAANSAGLPDGLQQLEQLDIRSALRDFAGRKLALFAADDALVPAQVLPQMSAMALPQSSLQQVPGSHAFVVEHAAQLAAQIRQFVAQ